MSNIVVIGDVMLDVSILGIVVRVAPEAPTGIITEVSRKETLGGAGNVYTNLIGAGERPYFITVVGVDDEAEKVKKLIKRGCVFSDVSRKTTTKTRVYAYTNHIRKTTMITRIDKESTEAFTKFKDLLTDEVCTEIKNADYILFSDYNKGFISEDLVEQIRRLNNRAKYVGDTKNFTAIYSGFYSITPNEFELHKIKETAEMPVSEILLKCQQIYGIAHPIITLGEKGVIYLDNSNNVTVQLATDQIAVDVTGAGDTFVAYLVSELSRDHDLDDAISFAIKAAGFAVTKEGTYTVKREEIE